MSQQERRYLLGEMEQLRRMLDKIPIADMIDRMSLEARLQEVKAALNESDVILSNDAQSESENLQSYVDELERRSFLVAKLNKELKSVQQALSRFERIYGKASDIFLTEYKAGKAGDNIAFIEWSSLVIMRNRLLVEQAALQHR